MDKTREIYISCDVEADGQIPVLHSMLQLGAVAIGWDTTFNQWQVTHRFQVNLMPYPGATQDAGTMTDFWAKFPDVWAKLQLYQVPPETAMRQFYEWLESVKAVWPQRQMNVVCAPTGYDFTFIRWYMVRFLGHSRPFNHSCIDLKSVASDRLGLPYRDTNKSSFPVEWKLDEFPHTHVAVEDAEEQAWVFARMLEMK